VAVLCEGDPFFYGSYMYLHERLQNRYETTVIPGVTGFSAAAASAGTPLVKRDDVFMALPGTLSAEELAMRVRSADAAVVMKLGRTFAKVRGAVEAAGAGGRGVYVERASSAEERIAALRDVEGDVPYMSLVLLPTRDRYKVERSPDDAYPDRGSPGSPDRGSPGSPDRGSPGSPDRGSPDRAHDEGSPDRSIQERSRGARRGSVAVVGLGPAGPEWLTPEAHAELAAADDLIGYDAYLARVPERRGQRRHASDNRVEAERARHALELAAAGARVAVVSSGDPGIFAMATAVLEALEENPALAHVEVRVVPGVSAMQAVAARVGAPLGHDFCAISLSDQLKPWDVVERRLDAAGAADLVLALYNPASRTRREQLERAVEVLRRHRAEETPVVVARAVGAEEESVVVTTLGLLAGELDAVDMRTLLIVGSSTTRTIPHAGTNGGAQRPGRAGHASDGSPPRVYTPRRYPA
jgi:precorrin-2 C20-methyltransferase / precorrin-3B C17-methyltransferase